MAMGLLSCRPGSHITTPDVQHLIRAELERQQGCWNNADLECFMEGYWGSDSLRFIGRSGVNYGWRQTLRNYRKSYPDRTAMGSLNFDLLHVEPLGSRHYLVTGRWELTRTEDDLSGHFTLIWKKIGGEWKIIHDHSS